MRTLLALIAAAAMIAGALYVRGDLGGGGGVGPLGGDPDASVVCVTELAEVCEALEAEGLTVTVEEAGVTAARLSGATIGDDDAWLTLAPWDAIVAETRQRNTLNPLPRGDGAVYARSPLVTAVWTERAAVLDRRCQPALSWPCVARFAGRRWSDAGGESQWGQVKPGFADPAENATGLLAAGQVASQLLGKSTFSARDIDGDKFLGQLTAIEDAMPSAGAGPKPFQQQLQFGPGRFDVVVTTEAEAAPLLERSPNRKGQLMLRYLEPVAVANVVLAPLQSADRADRVREVVGEAGLAALAEAGWRVAGQPPARGVPTEPALPAKTNLPSAGALEALRVRWGEIAR